MSPHRLPSGRLASPAPFQRSPIAVLAAGLAFFALGSVHAQNQTPSVAELQAEIARVQAENARLREALATQQQGQTAAPPAAAQPQAEAAPATTHAAPAADAPQELDTVVVRSRNRIEKLQDVPLSVSVVTGRELERLAATDVSDIVKRAGNVSWNRGNQRTSSLSIRGIGKVGQTEAQDPSVGLIVDGINYAYNALSSSYDFTDVDTVEVTRGPQGTLLGKNTSLGVVNITTRRPSFTPSAEWSLTFGQQDTVIGTVAGGGPVIDDLLAWRGTLSVSRGKGDIENNYNRDITYQNRDRISGRAQFLLTPSSDFNARFGFDVQPRASETTNGRTINLPTPKFYSNGKANTALTNEARLGRSWFKQYPGYSTDNYFYGGPGADSVTNDNQRGLVTGSHGAFAELNWKLGEHTITSITGYKDYHFNAVNDEGTPFDVYRNSGGFWNDYKQLSQEVRLTSPVGGFVDYQTGLYFMKVRNRADYQRVWGNDAGAWLATNANYTTLDKVINSDGSVSAGRELLRQSLTDLSMSFNSPTGKQDIKNESGAIFGQANWHFSDKVTLTTGLRITRENRQTTGRSVIKDNGNAGELNPALVNGYNLGGFNSDKSTGALGSNSTSQLQLADFAANKYFGTAITSTPGAAYNSLTAEQKKQIAAAKSIRATAIGTVFGDTAAESFEKTQPSFVISPSYKFHEDLTGYVSLQYGEKAGISQFANGKSYLVKPEKTTSYEAGLKSVLLNKTLVFNTDVFLMDIKDYQQSVRIEDQYTAELNNFDQLYYTSVTGNVPKVRASGLEFDGVYSGIKNTTLRFSGAYNKAVYKEFSRSAQPSEYGGSDPYRDISGQTVAGAPKYSFNIGVDYRLPIWGDKEFHTSANVAYTSKYNSDNALSTYGWIPDASVTDFAIGLGRRDKAFDVSLVVKNLFNDDTPQARTWSSYTPAFPRWAGIVLSGKL
ncbi:MAG TPA: TonB-dependent receptor [Candidatus Aquabacterium excrementipullorum]|nr:TonB-dependent receptor [Candidatus Aquabacterium excrementipullorum]